MTLEEERYLEECKKRIKPEQTEAVGSALNYGIPIDQIQEIVKRNLSGPQMQQIVFAIMEGVGDEALTFLMDSQELNPYQIKEAALGFMHGLTLQQVKTYASNGTNAHQMKKMRLELEKFINQGHPEPEDDGMKDYMQGLMKIMEESIKQFRESNERFEALSMLVKEHVVEEKNNEIKDLYISLQGKDETIRKLRQQLEEKEKVIKEMVPAVPKEFPVAGKKPDTKEVPELAVEKKPEVSEGNKRLQKWRGFMKKKENVLDKLIEAELTPEQMEEVRKCVEQGMTYEEVNQIIKSGGTPERMQKLREIMLLMKARKEGA